MQTVRGCENKFSNGGKKVNSNHVSNLSYESYLFNLKNRSIYHVIIDMLINLEVLAHLEVFWLLIPIFS